MDVFATNVMHDMMLLYVVILRSPSRSSIGNKIESVVSIVFKCKIEQTIDSGLQTMDQRHNDSMLL